MTVEDIYGSNTGNLGFFNELNYRFGQGHYRFKLWKTSEKPRVGKLQRIRYNLIFLLGNRDKYWVICEFVAVNSQYKLMHRLLE